MDNKDFRTHLKRHLFWEALLKIRAFVTQSSVLKPALAVGALVLVLSGLYYGQKYRISAAESAFARATEVFHQQVGPTAPAGLEGGLRFNTEAEKFQKAKTMFDDVASRYKSLPAGPRARYYSALSLLELGQSKEAEVALREIAALRNPDAIEPAMARLRIADLMLREGRAAEAATYYQTLIGDEASALPRDLLLYGLAESLEAAGQKIEARAAYLDLVNRHPQSPYAQDARQKIDALAIL